VSGTGISWAICKSASRSRQITTPAPHHSVFYRPDALPAAQPTVIIIANFYSGASTKITSGLFIYLLLLAHALKSLQDPQRVGSWELRLIDFKNLKWQTAIEKSWHLVMQNRFLKHISHPPSGIFTIKFLTASGLNRHSLHHRAKFSRVESYCCRDIAIFAFFYRNVKIMAPRWFIRQSRLIWHKSVKVRDR